MSLCAEPGGWNRDRFRVWVVVLAGTITAAVWILHGSAEVAFAAAALALQLVEMTGRNPL